MEATGIVAAQLRRNNEILQALTAAVGVVDSRTRAFPGTNLIGFTLWHLARTVDWAVNTMVRGVPEVAFDFPFEGPARAHESQFGVGVSLEHADAIAHATTPGHVAEYFDLVVAEAIGWLESSPDLGAVPDCMGHQPGASAYETSFYLEEARSFASHTTAQYLSGPVTGHARGHYGEIDVLRQILADGGA